MSDRETFSDVPAEAARWVARRDRGLDPGERAALDAWLADPRHQAEWDRLNDAWSLLGAAAGGAHDLRAEASAVEIRAARAQRRRTTFQRLAFAAAAAVALGFWAFTSFPVAPPSPAAAVAATYERIAPEAQRLALPDGSTVEVRSGGAVEPAFTAGERRVRLVRGQAFFTVAHDAARPFIVEKDGWQVRAVGTAFNVARVTENLDVRVTEGRVRLEPAGPPDAAASSTLDAGSRAQRTLGGTDSHVIVTRPTPAETEAALAWRHPHFVFRDTPLADVVQAFSRQPSVTVRLGSPALAGRVLSGRFRADNAEGFLRLAESTLGLRVERTPGGEVVLWPRP